MARDEWPGAGGRARAWAAWGGRGGWGKGGRRGRWVLGLLMPEPTMMTDFGRKVSPLTVSESKMRTSSKGIEPTRVGFEPVHSSTFFVVMSTCLPSAYCLTLSACLPSCSA